MSEPSSAENLDGQITRLRMLITGLLFGLLIFTAAVIFSALQLTGPLFQGPEMTYVFVGVAVMGLFAYLVAVPAVLRQQRADQFGTSADAPTETVDAHPPLVFGQFVLETFIRAALLETTAVLLVLGFLLTGDWLLLALAAVYVVLLAVIIPSRAKYDAWAERVRSLR